MHTCEVFPLSREILVANSLCTAFDRCAVVVTRGSDTFPGRGIPRVTDQTGNFSLVTVSGGLQRRYLLPIHGAVDVAVRPADGEGGAEAPASRLAVLKLNQSEHFLKQRGVSRFVDVPALRRRPLSR